MRACAGHTLYKDKSGALSASSPSGEEIQSGRASAPEGVFVRIRRCFRAKPFLLPPMSPRLLLAPLNGVLDDVNHLLVDASVFALCKDLQLAMKPRAHSQCDFPAVCRHCAVTSLLLYSAVTLLSRC